MTQSSADIVPTAERRLILGAFRSLFVAVIALALFGWIAEEVLEADTLRFDYAVRNAIHSKSFPLATTWMLRITSLGNWYVILPAAVLLAAFLVVKHRPHEARLLAVAMLGALMLDSVLKIAFHRARPSPYFGLDAPRTYSFPSGHALITFCFVGFLAGIITLHLDAKWLRCTVWALAIVVIMLVGLSRVYLGVHYPSDVIAGYAAALAWMSAVGFVAHREQKVVEKKGTNR